MVDKTLKENKYLSGIYIEIPWNAVSPEEQKFDLGRVDKIVELAQKKIENFIYHSNRSAPWTA